MLEFGRKKKFEFCKKKKKQNKTQKTTNSHREVWNTPHATEDTAQEVVGFLEEQWLRGITDPGVQDFQLIANWNVCAMTIFGNGFLDLAGSVCWDPSISIYLHTDHVIRGLTAVRGLPGNRISDLPNTSGFWQVTSSFNIVSSHRENGSDSAHNQGVLWEQPDTVLPSIYSLAGNRVP